MIEFLGADRPLELLEALLSEPHSRVSLERLRGAWLLRWFVPKGSEPPPYEKRASMKLPDDPALVAALQARLSAARAWRKRVERETREAAQALAQADRIANRRRRELRCRVLDASGRGRWMRGRIGKVFDIAAALGDDCLADFIEHSPWEARPRPAGRPRRPVGGWGWDRPPIDLWKD